MVTRHLRLRWAAAAALAAVALGTTVFTVEATNGNPINAGSQQKYTLAVVGDNPYGAAKLSGFPGFVEFINADPKVDLVAHVGDIKAGSDLCTDQYFETIRDLFAQFNDPLVFTPGDNEWTDCHRANNGNYKPTERLDKLRALFFPSPGETLGVRSKTVLTQADDANHTAYVENVMWMESTVVFSTLNVPGSNNGTVPWTGAWAGDPDQAAEVSARNAANMAWLSKTFDTAEANDANGVALILQADMWDSFGTAATLNGFDALVNAIGFEAIAFGKPVLLLVGDSHAFIQDQPYDGSAFFQSRHPSQPIAPNVSRVVVEGSATPADRFQYVRVTVDPKSQELFTIERVDYYPN